MADILALGISHYPPLSRPDDRMAGILARMLENPDLPVRLRTPDGWPVAMQEEWGNDHGAAAAGRHRAALVGWMERVRAALDDFRPDFVLIWGDDQYENFREDAIPPFAVLAYEQVRTTWAAVKYGPNVWSQPEESEIAVAGHRRLAKALVGGLLDEGFDITYAYEPLHEPGLSHAFLNTVLYLDWDRRGFPYPVVPIAVNCYGRRVISQSGLLPHFDRVVDDDVLDPPSPSPRRCFELGRAAARVLRRRPERVVLCASASWSHGFLTAKHNYLFPDTAADQRLFEALSSGSYDAWENTTLLEVEESGQHEMLNWFCLVGAMAELGQRPAWTKMVTTQLFNSNKAFVVFEAEPVP
jgi:hypothetical protein